MNMKWSNNDKIIQKQVHSSESLPPCSRRRKQSVEPQKICVFCFSLISSAGIVARKSTECFAGSFLLSSVSWAVVEYYAKSKNLGHPEENLLTCLAGLFTELGSQKKKTGVIGPKRFVQGSRKIPHLSVSRIRPHGQWLSILKGWKVLQMMQVENQRMQSHVKGLNQNIRLSFLTEPRGSGSPHAWHFILFLLIR